jgi:hypothetical protein
MDKHIIFIDNHKKYGAPSSTTDDSTDTFFKAPTILGKVW